MIWANIGHVYRRELRDQWRDRRTLLSVVLLPLLLYPILGIGFLQVSQFMQEKPVRILVVGHHRLDLESGPELGNPLFQAGGWRSDLATSDAARLTTLVLAPFSHPDVELAAQILAQSSGASDLPQDPGQSAALGREREERIDLQHVKPREAGLQSEKQGGVPVDASPGRSPAHRREPADRGQRQQAHEHWGERLRSELRRHSADALLWIPALDPTDGTILDSSLEPALGSGRPTQDRIPRVHLFLNSSSDSSVVAANRIEGILNLWYRTSLQRSVERRILPAETVTPFHFESRDLAQPTRLSAQLWCKILPFIVFMWTLTGAFYCAVDLCAGEKERGTLEALLVTPASRREIVLGKLLTTMTFGLTSGLLNLLCTVATGVALARQMRGMTDMESALAALSTPPWLALAWLALGAVPIAALFGAISLAIAAFARSSKEGQHYLMPVLMICLPLLVIPLMPGATLNLGMSLIPVTGLMFLLRALVEQDYGLAARHAPPVLAVTLWCVHLATSWAVAQFRRESVLFRSGERFSLRSLLAATFQRRGGRPTLGQVALLVAVVFGLKFFLQVVLSPVEDWPGFVRQSLSVLLIAVALPAILLAVLCTRSPIDTLRLRMGTLSSLAAACLLAICLHPLILAFQQVVMQLYPLAQPGQELLAALNMVLDGAPGFWAVLLVLAVMPALCEELAFRGFVLSGLRQWNKPVQVVLISAVLFGITHGLLQQAIVASLTGVILAIVAIRTHSLWPCIVYHATHNALTLQLAYLDPATIAQSRFLQFLFAVQLDTEGRMVGLHYEILPTLFLAVVGIWLFLQLQPRQSQPKPSDDVAGLERPRVEVPSVGEPAG